MSDTNAELSPRYDPHGVEERWQETWEAEGLYNADPDPSRTPYVDAHPPPNVTGELHTGHALQLAIGDTSIRMKRMQGFNTLFQPGLRPRRHLDAERGREACSSTEGTSRQELGREAFEARVWEWLHEYGGKIMFQFRRMGASLDYRRTRFTMDDAYVRAVMRFFVHLYDARLDLPREPDHQLVPVPRDVALRSRARARRRRRHALDDPLPARRRRRVHRDRDGATGDDPRRRRGRGASRRRALQASGRPRGRSSRGSSGACR